MIPTVTPVDSPNTSKKRLLPATTMATSSEIWHVKGWGEGCDEGCDEVYRDSEGADWSEGWDKDWRKNWSKVWSEGLG